MMTLSAVADNTDAAASTPAAAGEDSIALTAPTPASSGTGGDVAPGSGEGEGEVNGRSGKLAAAAGAPAKEPAVDLEDGEVTDLPKSSGATPASTPPSAKRKSDMVLTPPRDSSAVRAASESVDAAAHPGRSSTPDRHGPSKVPRVDSTSDLAEARRRSSLASPLDQVSVSGFSNGRSSRNGAADSNDDEEGRLSDNRRHKSKHRHRSSSRHKRHHRSKRSSDEMDRDRDREYESDRRRRKRDHSPYGQRARDDANGSSLYSPPRRSKEFGSRSELDYYDRGGFDEREEAIDYYQRSRDRERYRARDGDGDSSSRYERDRERDRRSARTRNDGADRERDRDRTAPRTQRERNTGDHRQSKDEPKERKRPQEERGEAESSTRKQPRSDASTVAVNGNIQGKPEGISASAAVTKKPDDPQPLAAVSEFTFPEMDEEKQLEERRKRRELIMQKYRKSEVSTPANEVSTPANGGEGQDAGTPSESVGPKRSHLAGTDAISDSPLVFETSSAPDVITEKSVSQDASSSDSEVRAGDYNPNDDRAEDEERQKRTAMKSEHRIAVTKDDDPMFNPPTVVAAAAADEFDMFAPDDIFAPATAASNTNKGGTTHILESAPVVRSLDNPALTDNWDDPEGYYRVILGEVLDNRYHVYSNLGKGVFSSVVKAQDTKNGDTDVAIKIIRSNDTMYRAGLKEIGILKKLQAADPDDRKHVIRLIRHFEHRNHLCMVFESLSCNLREILKKFSAGLNIKGVRVYAQQLLLALSLQRKCNVLHADIKPDNILVTENRNILKLCDLGSASDASENEITPYLVSRFYRAPEIILGLPYDFAIDMWSVGCTLYELFTGKILFPGRSNNQMLKLMLELKGKFSNKMLRKGQFTPQHFDDNLNFRLVEFDKISGKDVVKTVTYTKPTRDLKSRLMSYASGSTEEELKLVLQFVDFLERCLHLGPDKRLTVKEALAHPFIIGTNL
ncbi:kinase-like domain-containing protein [Zopfochytrium polystomum]|nr:kinase-like domain-containing protein [Zopfochytrium polystomum]